MKQIARLRGMMRHMRTMKVLRKPRRHAPAVVEDKNLNYISLVQVKKSCCTCKKPQNHPHPLKIQEKYLSKKIKSCPLNQMKILMTHSKDHWIPKLMMAWRLHMYNQLHPDSVRWSIRQFPGLWLVSCRWFCIFIGCKHIPRSSMITPAHSPHLSLPSSCFSSHRLNK